MPAGAVAALREQLDLTEVELNPGLVLFEVQEPWPLRSDITDLELPDSGEADLGALLRTAIERPSAVLGTGAGTRFSGELPADRTVAQASTADAGWSLTVDGTTAERSPLLGWQQQFTTSGGGDAELAWSTPMVARGLQALQVAALIALVVLASRRRRLVAAPPGGAGSERRGAARRRGPDGEVLSAERDLTGGEYSADAPGGGRRRPGGPSMRSSRLLLLAVVAAAVVRPRPLLRRQPGCHLGRARGAADPQRRRARIVVVHVVLRRRGRRRDGVRARSLSSPGSGRAGLRAGTPLRHDLFLVNPAGEPATALVTAYGADGVVGETARGGRPRADQGRRNATFGA